MLRIPVCVTFFHALILWAKNHSRDGILTCGLYELSAPQAKPYKAILAFFD